MKKMKVTWDELDSILESISGYLEDHLNEQAITVEEFTVTQFYMLNYVVNEMLDICE